MCCGSATVVRADMGGNQLYEMCSQRNNNLEQYGCLYYIVGVTDGVKTERHPSISTQFCIPNGVTNGQLTDIAFLWLQKHPEQRHYTAASDVIVALTEAFPCAK